MMDLVTINGRQYARYRVNSDGMIMQLVGLRRGKPVYTSRLCSEEDGTGIAVDCPVPKRPASGGKHDWRRDGF